MRMRIVRAVLRAGAICALAAIMCAVALAEGPGGVPWEPNGSTTSNAGH